MLVSLAMLMALTPGPTDVSLAWTPGAGPGFEVTWNEAGDVRNRVDVVNADGSATNYASQFVAAGAPNRLVMSNSIGPGDYRIRVTVVDEDGTVLSEPGDSAEFDTDRTPVPVITSAVPRVDGTVRYTWVPGPYTDTNPGDPLDVPADGRPVYQPVVSPPVANDYELVGPRVRGAGSLVVRDRPAPLFVGLLTVENEWSGSRGAIAEVNGTRVTAKIPASATPGGRLTVTGRAEQALRACDMAACEPVEWPDPGRELTLQARAGGSAPWQAVAKTKSRADGTYTFTSTFAGTRDYRVIALPVAWVPEKQARAYAESPARTVRGTTGPVEGGGGGQDGGQGGGQGGGLPITGAPVLWIAGAGGLLVALGVVFAALGRRRRRAS
ncbi:hypothetical protein [Actinoplanes sp. URMC 104]|uniref:hypothetical protein n=1 Tax=Actinoplanes sp. URMC 104 TaxID=3423409 RepID=UPI003F197EB0